MLLSKTTDKDKHGGKKTKLHKKTIDNKIANIIAVGLISFPITTHKFPLFCLFNLLANNQ